MSINADDYYGKKPFLAVAEHLAKPAAAGGVPAYCMVGYPIRETLSDHAAVTRAVCQVDGAGFLEALVERMKVERVGTGARYVDEGGAARTLAGDEVVSMNFWGFTPAVFAGLEEHLSRFLTVATKDAAAGNPECLIPTVVGDLIREKAAKVRVLLDLRPLVRRHAPGGQAGRDADHPRDGRRAATTPRRSGQPADG